MRGYDYLCHKCKVCPSPMIRLSKTLLSLLVSVASVSSCTGTGGDSAANASQFADIASWEIKPLPLPAFYDAIVPSAINGQGEIVGVACDAKGSHCHFSFLYKNGVTSIVPVQQDGSAWRRYIPSGAVDISDAGEIIGTGGFLTSTQSYYKLADLFIQVFGTVRGITNRGVIWKDWGSPVRIVNGTEVAHMDLEAGSAISGISDNGHVVMRTAQGAFVIEHPTGDRYALTSPKQGWQIAGLGPVNAAGEVIGSIEQPGASRAVLWKDGVATELGTLGGSYTFARSLNDQGVVVGRANLPGDSASVAFIASGTTTMSLIDLKGVKEAGWTELVNAIDVNNANQVIGVGTKDGRREAFLLQPKK